MIATTFKNLGFNDFAIKINNRKILNGLYESLGQKEKSVEIMRIVDKLDKNRSRSSKSGNFQTRSVNED